MRVQMERKVSAVDMAPVEIWKEILDNLLYDPMVSVQLKADPFYPGCNYHTALQEWCDRKRLLEWERQRTSLRLVSRAWRDLIDKIPGYYALLTEHGALSPNQMLSAIRVHLDIREKHCECQSFCSCFDEKWIPNHRDREPDFGSTLYDLLANSESSVQTLVTSSRRWYELIEAIPPPIDTRQLSGIKGLYVMGWIRTSEHISTVFPNLTFLYVQLSSPYQSLPPIHLPSLITLILKINLCTLGIIKNWSIPNVQYAEITDISCTSKPDLLGQFLESSWPSLLSLKIISEAMPITLPGAIWDRLPNLRYLGISCLQDLDNYDIPPVSHPLRAIANLESDQPDARGILAKVTWDWMGLRVISDNHRWEKQPINDDPTPRDVFTHPHDRWKLCLQCIEDMVYMCEIQGLRYEDASGRTLTEYRTAIQQADTNASHSKSEDSL